MNLSFVESPERRISKVDNAVRGMVDTISALRRRFPDAPIIYLGCGRTYSATNPQTLGIPEGNLRERHEDECGFADRVREQVGLLNIPEVTIRDAFRGIHDGHIRDPAGHLTVDGAFEVGKFVEESLDIQ